MISRRLFLKRAGLIAGASLLSSPGMASSSPLPTSPRESPQDRVEKGSPTPELLERARALLQAAPLIDTHNDLPSMLYEGHVDLAHCDLGTIQPTLCADVPRLREGRVGAQYWSVWVPSATQKTHTSLHESLREFDVALRLIRSQPEFEQARTADDIERIHNAGRIACLIGVEGGHMIEDSLGVLRIFYELGARYLTLTHWDNINWADAATDRPEHNGLTEFGKQVVREMNRLGMFVDISHVSADTMRDALSVSRAPVIFSHSGSLALNPHPRNVPDDVLRQLAANGGVIHVNFIREFVSTQNAPWQDRRAAALRELHLRVATDQDVDTGMRAWEAENPYPRPTIADVANQIDHIRDVAGVDHIGIGADFFNVGHESMVAGLDDVTRYPHLFAELLRRGYSDADIFRIAGRNHLRAMQQMERVAAGLQRAEAPLLDKAAVKEGGDL